MILKYGKSQLNTEAFHGYTKEQFTKEFAGKLPVDLSEVWDEIKKHIPKQTRKRKIVKDEKEEGAE